MLAVRQLGPVRAGQPAAERRRPGGLGLGCASIPEAAQNLQPLHQPRAAHHPQLFWENHKNRVEGKMCTSAMLLMKNSGSRDTFVSEERLYSSSNSDIFLKRCWNMQGTIHNVGESKLYILLSEGDFGPCKSNK